MNHRINLRLSSCPNPVFYKNPFYNKINDFATLTDFSFTLTRHTEIYIQTTTATGHQKKTTYETLVEPEIPQIKLRQCTRNLPPILIFNSQYKKKRKKRV